MKNIESFRKTHRSSQNFQTFAYLKNVSLAKKHNFQTSIDSGFKFLPCPE